MLDEAPLGLAKIKANVRLRRAMLINALLFNSERWHDVKHDSVMDLERADQAFLRGLVQGQCKVGIPALYLDLGQEPLRFILATRRILYLQTILKRELKELTRKSYEAQKADPVTGDFYLLVLKELEMIDLKLSDTKIQEL